MSNLKIKKMFYIRFTTDIHRDIERGYSTHFSTGAKLPGICAWSINDSELSPYASDEEIIAAAKKTAVMISENTYGGYDNNGTFAVVEGRYVGSSNDGVCIEVTRVIKEISL